MKITPLTQPLHGKEAIFLQLDKLGRNTTARSNVVIKADNTILYAAEWYYSSVKFSDGETRLLNDLRVTKLTNPSDEDSPPVFHPAPNERCKVFRYNDRDVRVHGSGVDYLTEVLATGGIGFGGGSDLFIIPNYIALDRNGDNGIGANFVTEFPVFFTEADDLTIEQQWERINWFANLTGLVPVLIVYSGGKSLHVYWKLSQPIIDRDRWQRIQRKLILIFHSDPNIQNANREMRLAGVYRPSKGKYQTIEYHSDYEYTVDEFEEKLDATGLFPHGLSYERWLRATRDFYRTKNDTRTPEQKEEALKRILSLPEEELNPRQVFSPIPRVIRVTGTVEIPLELCLSKTNQENLLGVGSDRNAEGYNVAKDLIGCSNDLAREGIPYSGDPYQLFIDYCQRCPSGSGWDQREWESVWRSANQGNSTPARGHEGLLNFVHWWRYQNDPDYREALVENYRGEVEKIYQQHKGRELFTKLSKVREQFHSESYLTSEEWRSLIDSIAFELKVKPIYGRVGDNHVPELHQPEVDEKKAGYQRFRDYTPDIKLAEQYLSGQALEDALNDLLKPHLVVGIKSPLGSNKTGAIGEFINRLPAPFNNHGTILLSDLNRLLIQSVERFNKLGERTFYHLHQDDAYDKVADPEGHIALCFQSLLRYLHHNFNEKILIVDEPMSVFKGFIDGDTLKKEGLQRKISFKLREMFSRVSLIFVIDGNLTNSCCKLVHKLSGGDVIKIENFLPSPRKYKIRLWSDDKLLLAQAFDDIKLGLRVVLTSDNQSGLRQFYQQLLNQGLGTPDSIKICDSSSKNDECPEALLKNPSEYFSDHPEVKVFMYSPSMNRGFDISGDIFDKQFGFYYGILNIEQIDQQTFRLRSEQTERHICITPKMKAVHENSWTDNQMADVIKFSGQLMLKKGQIKDKVSIAKTIETLIARVAEDPFVEYESALRDAEEYEQENLPLRFKEFMRGKGIEIIDNSLEPENLVSASEEIATGLKEIAKKQKEELQLKKQERAIAVTIAPSTEKELNQLQKLSSQDQSSSQPQDQSNKEPIDQPASVAPPDYSKVTVRDVAVKQKLEKELPGFIKSEQFTVKSVRLLTEDKPALIQQVTRYLMLQDNTQSIKKLERQFYEIISDFRKFGYCWFNGFDREALKIWAYQKLGILEIIQTLKDEYFTTNHPLIQSLLRKASKAKIVTATGIKQGKYPAQTLRKFFKWVGFDLKVKKTHKNRQYLIVPIGGEKLHQQLQESLKNRIPQGFEEELNWSALLQPLPVNDSSEPKSAADFPGIYNKQEKVPRPLDLTQQGFSPDSGGKKNNAIKRPDFDIQERKIEWVRYQGESYRVAHQNGEILSLRQAGMTKIIHRGVSIFDCDEVTYETVEEPDNSPPSMGDTGDMLSPDRESEPVSLPSFEEMIWGTDFEIKRVGGTVEYWRKYIVEKYGKRSRHFLEDSQLLEFWNYLKTLSRGFLPAGGREYD